MYLLDTGVVFAAVHEPHVRHRRVCAWLATATAFSTCGITQIGAFRLLLNEAAMRGAPLGPVSAHQVVADLMRSERHSVLPCPSIDPAYVGRTVGHRAAFDDYLVQISATGQARLVTLDQSLSMRWPNETVLLN